MRRAVSLLITGLLLLAACRREGQQASQTRTFYSAALSRKVTYRIIVPAHLPPGPVSVLYLLHGAGGSADDWADHSDIASLLPGSVLVMPFGANSYFMNSATHPEDRYEDFITRDLIADAERSLPARPRRRAIAGVSMGGCAAIVLALRHADLFPFAAGLSPAVDVPERAFNWHRPLASLNLRNIYGPPGSAIRSVEDPFKLAAAIDPKVAPYLFLSTGEEPLEEPIQRFVNLVQRHALPYEFHKQPGGHGWAQWNSQLPALVQALHMKQPAAPASQVE